jgi:hypothetical protein
MKNIAKVMLVLLALILASVVVSAAPSMTVNDLSLGSTTQERSNEREDLERFVTGTVTISNTGTSILSNFGFSVSEGTKYAGKLEITNTTALPTTLNPGNSSTVSFEVRVPENLDAVDEDLIAKAFEVAQISFTASSGATSVSAVSKVSIQAENNLEIDDLDVKFNGNSDDVDDGDTVKDIKPGNSIEVILMAKNTFSSKQDLDFEDVVFTIEMDDDSAFDISDEEEDIGDIERGDREQATITMDVEMDAEKGTYTMEVFLEGTDDEYGTRHGEYWLIELRVERESHDIAIERMTLSRESVCAGEDATLTVKVVNLGRNEEDEVAISLEAAFLPSEFIYSTSKEVSEELDEGDSASETFIIPVDEEVRLGKYRVTVRTYYDFDEESDDDLVYLTVESCAPPVPVPVCGDTLCEGEETCSTCPQDCGACPTCNDGLQNQGETGVDCGGPCPACEPIPPTGGVVQPPVTVVEEAPLYVWALAAACGVLLVVIIIMMVALVRKR